MEQTKGRILVVDDDPEVINFLKTFLEFLGCSVITATSGQETTKLLETKRPDLALLDIKMETGRAGLDVLKWIREQNLKMKIVMLTSRDDRPATEEALSLGADRYLTKPVDPNNLEAVVRELLGEPSV